MIDVCFPTDYASILAKVDAVNVTEYSKTRNFIDGSTSGLSPYISRGVLSLPQLKDSILAKYSKKEALKFITELAWREYFQRIWWQLGDQIHDDIKRNQVNVQNHLMVKAIAERATGIDVIDQQLSVLEEEGYLHNHIRMYIASICCNIAHTHWHKPAQWMYYHLLDGDIASNTLSWQWVAGTFSSRKYFANQENVNHYTHSYQRDTFLDTDYDSLIHGPTPEHLKKSVDLDLRTNLPAKTSVVVDINKPLLLYNSYNLDPIWHRDEEATRIVVLEPSHFSRYPVSSKVVDFIIDLSHQIEGIQLYVGEINQLPNIKDCKKIISKAHPAFTHYPGIKEPTQWMFPIENSYYSSFSAYWKVCEKFFWRE
jgi:deoxyribodipyrimidine photo-lyase